MEILDQLHIGYCEIDTRMKIKTFNTTYQTSVIGKLKKNKYISDCISNHDILLNLTETHKSGKLLNILKGTTLYRYKRMDNGHVQITIISLSQLDQKLQDLRHDANNILNWFINDIEYDKIKEMATHIHNFDLKNIYTHLF